MSSTTTFPSIRYAGRLAGDPRQRPVPGRGHPRRGHGRPARNGEPLGRLQLHQSDPTDDATFWFTHEYYTAAGQAMSTAGWQTRVGSFKFTGVPAAPRGALTAHVTNCSTGAPGGVSFHPERLLPDHRRCGLAAFATMAPGTYTVTVSKPLAGYLPAGQRRDQWGNATLNLCLPTVPVSRGARLPSPRRAASRPTASSTPTSRSR